VTESAAEFAAWLARRLGDVEVLIDRVAAAGERIPPFHDQLVSRRSKRLRSQLLLIASRAAAWGQNVDETLVHAAATIELLHEGTLYHDDIVDLAERRRGLPTTRAVHGPAVAALAGSELLYASAELAATLPMTFRRAYGRAGDALCRGQLREIEAIGDERLSPRQRIRIMRDKTGRLFSLSAAMGAHLGGARPEIERELRRFGLRFGLCYQLADDLQDLTAPSVVLGREPGADLANNVMTLPILLALAEPSVESSAVRTALRRGQDGQALTRTLRTLRAGKGLQLTQGILGLWAQRALDELVWTVSAAPEAVRYLRELTAGVVRRATGTEPDLPRVPMCTT
jgi:heptaprenyl diphosphate synthase